MRSNIKLLIFTIFISNITFGQKVCNEFYNKKFSKSELVADIEFIKEKILNAHINPFTEISKEEFEKNIIQIENSLKDGMTQKDFYFLAKPIFVKLNDEHSGLNDFCITDSIKNNIKFFPLRFKYENQKVILTENYSGESINNGDELLSINEFSIENIIEGCSNQVFGISEERKTIAVEKLWLYLSKFCFFITDDFNLKFKSGKIILIKGQNWEELNKNVQQTKKKDTNISILKYEKIKDFGYLTINSFNDKQIKYDKWELKIDSIFSKIKNDKVQKLIIDVSNNGGGNSAIGNLIIDYFSNKSYKDYGGKWKKSKEYSDFMKKNDFEYAPYEKLQNGELMPLVSDENKPSKNKNRFNGKT
nr:S41 family peptidase [Flavobacterium branchiophilum]